MGIAIYLILETLTDIDMLLMVEKGIRREYHAIYQYINAHNKYMNLVFSIQYLDVNNLYDWA